MWSLETFLRLGLNALHVAHRFSEVPWHSLELAPALGATLTLSFQVPARPQDPWVTGKRRQGRNQWQYAVSSQGLRVSGGGLRETALDLTQIPVRLAWEPCGDPLAFVWEPACFYMMFWFRAWDARTWRWHGWAARDVWNNALWRETGQRPLVTVQDNGLPGETRVLTLGDDWRWALTERAHSPVVRFLTWLHHEDALMLL